MGPGTPSAGHGAPAGVGAGSAGRCRGPSNTTEAATQWEQAGAMHLARVGLTAPPTRPPGPSVSPARSSKLDVVHRVHPGPPRRWSRIPLRTGKYFLMCSARSSTSPFPGAGPAAPCGRIRGCHGACPGHRVPGAGRGNQARAAETRPSRGLLDQLRMDGGLPQFPLLPDVEDGRRRGARRRPCPAGSGRWSQSAKAVARSGGPNAHPSGRRSSEGR